MHDDYIFNVFYPIEIFHVQLHFFQFYWIAEILNYVTSTPSNDLPFRPTVMDNDDIVWNDALKKIVRNSWAENPEDRPSFTEIQKSFRKIFR